MHIKPHQKKVYSEVFQECVSKVWGAENSATLELTSIQKMRETVLTVAFPKSVSINLNTGLAELRYIMPFANNVGSDQLALIWFCTICH